MDTKTIKELNQKIWYRLLKVVYIFSLIFVIGVSLVFVAKELEFLDENYIALGLVLYILYPIFIYIGFEIVRRSFFYIILGTMKPSDDNYFIRLKKHKKLIIAISIILIIALAYGIWDANQIDRDRYLKRNSSVTIPNIDLPDLPQLPKLPKLPKLPSIKIPQR